MKHNKSINHLGRKTSHRKLMLSNMACSLIEHKRINTTIAKAKALKVFIEPLITKSKKDTTHNRRIVFSRLRNKYSVSELFREIVTKVGDRPGGYTRIIKLGNRLGDNAKMAMIEFVDYNDTYKKENKKKTTRRGQRGRKSKEESKETQIVEKNNQKNVAEKEKEEKSIEKTPETLKNDRIKIDENSEKKKVVSDSVQKSNSKNDK